MAGSGIEIRELILGPPRFGKTALAVQLAQQDVCAGRWHFAHDTGGDYVRAGFPYYESPEEFWQRAAAAKAKDLPISRGAAIGGAWAEPVIELAKEWVERARVPTVVTGDEAILLSKTGSTYLGEDLAEVWARGHHIGMVRDAQGETIKKVGLGLRINTQWPTQLPKQLYVLASRVYIFRVTDKNAEHVESVMSLEGKLVDAIRQLHPAEPGVRGGTYIVVEPGVGIVGVEDGQRQSTDVSRSVRREEEGNEEGARDSRRPSEKDQSPGPDALQREQPEKINGAADTKGLTPAESGSVA